MRTLCGRTGLKNRLDARQEPIMGINPGRNAPLNLTNDNKSGYLEDEFSNKKRRLNPRIENAANRFFTLLDTSYSNSIAAPSVKVNHSSCAVGARYPR